LALNWRKRKRGFLPALENSEVTGINPPTADRVDLWVRTNVHVKGWPRWVFIKLHSHGTQEESSTLLLSEAGGDMYRQLLDRYNDGSRFVLHFVTSRELFLCVRALEQADSDAIARIEAFDYVDVRSDRTPAP
jgi:hypothetical protein